MSRFFSLALILLGLFCFLGSSQAQQCQVTLESPVPPPVCTTKTVNGKPVKTCQAIGSALTAFVTTPKEPTFSTDFPIATIEFAGTCACEYNLWDKAGLKGARLRSIFSKRSYYKVTVSKLWNRKGNSIKVTCKF